MMNRSVLLVNHGALTLTARGVSAETRGNTRDIYSESEHASTHSLSPAASKSSGIIPGMQEVFTKFSSPPHPSPILAATLCGYNGQTDNYLNEMSTTRTTSSCVTTPQSLYSDPISSAEAQSNFENSFEASSSSAIDLVDFPSNLMSNALEDFESLDCDPHESHLPVEACQTIEGMEISGSVIQMDDDEMDIVPNELVQFVSESTRRIRKQAAGCLSNGDSDLDEMDHDARIASLCLPILQPPSLVSSQLSDGMRPPSLSPQSPDNASLVANHSDDLTAIEFTRAYLSEPADSHSSLTETRDFETYHSVATLTEFKSADDSDMVDCKDASSDPIPNPLSPFSRTASGEIDFHETGYGQIVLKPTPVPSAPATYFSNQGFSEFPAINSLATSGGTPTMNSHQTDNPSHILPGEDGTETIKICSDAQLMGNSVNFTSSMCMGPSSSTIDVRLNLMPARSPLDSDDTTMGRPETKATIFQKLTTPTAVSSSISALKCESDLALSRFSSVCTPASTFDKSPVISDLLPKDSVIGSTWTFDHITNKGTSSNCSTSALKQEPIFTQVGTPLVSAPVFCPPAPFIASTRSNIAESYPPSGTIELVQHTTLSSPAPGTFTSPQPSLSFLLTADSNRSKILPSCVSTDQSSNHTLNYLNLPLQVLQALPNLRPGMSILLNVKNNRANGQVNAITSTPPGTQPFSGIAAKRTDGPVFLLPNSQIPVCVTSKIQPSQIIPAQHSCQLNPNLNQTVLFMPSMPSSSVNSTVLSGGLNSIASTNANGTLSGTSSVFPSGTQFLLLRSPSKPDSKQNDLTQVPNINPTPDTSFLISGNLAQKAQLKSSLLLIPTAVPPAAQHSCMFPNLTSQFNFQTAASNLLDVNTLPSWGLRPPDAQSILGLNPNPNCLQLGLGTPNAAVQNALLAAALSRSISNSVAASTLSLPITVLPTNPQTLLMPPATSVLKPSSSSIPVLPGPLASFLSTNTTQTTPVITTGSFSSVNFDPNVKLSMATQPGHSSASVSTIPASPTAPSISYVPVSTSDLQSLSHSSMSPPKKLVVLPSADNLLCSSSRPSFSSDCTSLVSTPCPHSEKQTEPKFPLLSSFVSQSLSPCVLPSPTGTLSSTKSTSPAPQSSTPGHVNCRRRHQCPYCPKSCERKDNLQAHIRTHTGERPYPCRFCPKAFPQKDHLRAHIRTHTGEKPYRCPQCMKAFAQLGNLHRHVKTHKR